MVGIAAPIYYMFHPQELRSIIQWKVWHNPVHERDDKNASETEKQCFHFLKLTSRSFSAVIMELHPELLLPVCLFYLILRGLDTIEDDTSIPLRVKEPLLRDFHNILEKDGWSFDGNRAEEKDRELLVQFHNVVTEFKKIKPVYRTIIKDITKKMGNGMADYCKRAESDTAKVKTVKEYDLYCYYVAGIVGEGLTRLFVEAGFANPALLKRTELYISMGLFLQKTNIIRDVKEDHVDNRNFWPKEIWSKHVDEFEDLFKPENREAALNCNSEMILNALEHADECLFYLAGLKEQSIFNFCAIPQSMAIATLELCFRNQAMFERNVKITKGSACQLMFQSTQNVRAICDLFRQYVRKIHKKNTPRDPNFLKISVACGKVEKFVESIFPSQSVEYAQRKAKQEPSPEEAERARLDAEARQDTMYIMLALFGILAVLTVIMVSAAWFLGARFDLAFQQLKDGKFRPSPPHLAEHQEL
ncbi:farnesyl-diphosphate farnesyltransferase [Emergomyces pasteurianus Ep9510]|uniref:Squalene synthase n=1 Tax=Emergomyces pasteurianus Ep9510 TaxID=1447872 RepID=A0A1J9PDI5_9EURO|nr:farnesyl-diphosphate farnesyltransferase [Emergomyces pasteurianus Ep9510]